MIHASPQPAAANQAWGSDVVAETIRALGYRYIALVPGASFRGLHDSLVNHLGNTAPEMVVCLHEEHAVSIADGFSRVADEPMAVALHSNVGLMHATMTIFNAWCDRRPMLIIGATGPVDAHKRRPWIDWIHTAQDQAAIVRPYIKWDNQPASAEAAVEAVLRADQIARTSPFGPVYVCLDAEMQEGELDREVRVPPAARYRPGAAPEAPQADLRAAVEALRSARLPVILVGRGSRGQAEWDARVRLAEATGAVVLTTTHNASAFPTEHPSHILAPVGERPSEDETRLLREADLILSLDWHDLAGFLSARLGASQTQAPAAAQVIHCSLDRYVTNGWSMDHQALPAVDVPVLAHPDRFVAQLLAAFGGEGAQALRAPHGFAHWTKAPPPPASDRFGAQQMAYTLAECAAERPITFARLSFGWPQAACRFRSPLDFLGKDGGGAVGTGPGHTIGAALALRDSGRLVVGVVGDGDYLMGVNALWTAAHRRIPMMIVVANNRSYFNDEVHQERVAKQRGRPVENKWIGQRLSDPDVDLVAMAKAQGFTGEGPVRSAEELRAAFERGAAIVEAGGCHVIDAWIEPGY
ncbi:MAG TPA: thiamine pyrophosphate-binding protein [Microvirga sp.]|jgi:benzoylformate decarboxylase|nr:thiamine pyrophosphate-binding protein [Microvirga sp.]